MLVTKTGKFRIGFREVDVFFDNFDSEVTWAAKHDFATIDIVTNARTMRPAASKVPVILDNGLKVGSIDLPSPERNDIISGSKTKQEKAIAVCKTLMTDCAEALRKHPDGKNNPLIFWTMMIPEDPSLPKKDNYGHMLEGYGQLNPLLADLDAKLVVEGWPGPGCVVCTPEGYRTYLRECGSDRVGVHYDPSHLIRMGIDPLRFLIEFGKQVYHAHAKDTELLTENAYEYGWELPAIFAKKIRYGSHAWRYTIPGHGQMRWSEAFRILESCGFNGSFCIELEDENFNIGDGDGEKLGLILGGNYLSGC